jgi:hypothetical protein
VNIVLTVIAWAVNDDIEVTADIVAFDRAINSAN